MKDRSFRMDIHIENMHFDNQIEKTIVFEIVDDDLLNISRATVQVYKRKAKGEHCEVKLNDENLPLV